MFLIGGSFVVCGIAAPRLRVMLKVSKVCEGEEARLAARKKRFKYFKLVSVAPIG